MPFVIDTNQASRLPSRGSRGCVVSLSPYVLSEILLRGDPRPTLQLLRTFDIRLGLETSDVMCQVAQLSADEITEFEPFPLTRQKYRLNYEAMRTALYGRRQVHLEWAHHIKSGHLEYCASLLEKAKRFRKRVRDCGMGDRKFSTFEEAVSELASTPDSFLDVILGSITNDGNRTTKAQPPNLLDAVLSNQYLGRLFRAQLAYYVCISRLWKEESLNFDPSPTRDDMTDITLPLYAADGDVIVTADEKLALLVSLIEPEGKVRTSKASDIM